jgi:hypothetical protein
VAGNLFTTVLTPAILTGNQELVLALGRTTIVNLTSTGNVTIFGLFATGGNVDGMVVCLSNVNNSSFQFTGAHESGSASAATNRFRNAGLTDVSGGTGAGCLWYRYNAAISTGRWIMIGKTS